MNKKRYKILAYDPFCECYLGRFENKKDALLQFDKLDESFYYWGIFLFECKHKKWKIK